MVTVLLEYVTDCSIRVFRSCIVIVWKLFGKGGSAHTSTDLPLVVANLNCIDDLHL